jgi:hypothetical protein
MTIQWTLIRTFDAVAKTGSLSGASRQLGLTQPTLSRQVAALEAAKAGLPSKLAREKRIAWEKWLAGEQQRERRERKRMALVDEETQLVWEEMRAIAARKYKARQRELTQGRKRLHKMDKAILKVLTANRKQYLKQQAKMTDEDIELRKIEAEEMKKLGKKQKPLLNGWVTKKRMVAEAFAKLPFVCQAVDLFKRVDLAILLNHAEKSYCDPQLDTSFGMVSCVQGSHIVTFSGERPALSSRAVICIKDDLFTVVKYETKTVHNEDTTVLYSGSITLGVYKNGSFEGAAQWRKKPGAYKTFFLEIGKVERYRLIPEDLRPALLSTIFRPVLGDGRLW